MVVASPRRDAVDEALFFADRLHESAGRVEALIVNRMFPSSGRSGASDRPRGQPAAAELRPRSPPTWRTWIGSPVGNSNTSPSSPTDSRAQPSIRVPFLADDVHDVDGPHRGGPVVV